MTRISKISNDGMSYEVLKSGNRVVLPSRSYSAPHPTIGAYQIHHLYVQCEEIKKSLLPLDSNPREPSGRSGQVKEMRDTLEHYPSSFQLWNNGMTLICDDVVFDSSTKKCTVDFGLGEGVCNGGHTYFAIVTTPFPISQDAVVHLELIQLPSSLGPAERKTAITDIARARNNNAKLALMSQADYQGYFDHLKARIMDSTLVRWHEGDSSAKGNAIGADHLIRLLAALDPVWYYHPELNPKGDMHRSASTSIQSINNKWYDAMEDPQKKESRLSHMAFLLNDMLEIRDMISESLLVDSFSPGFRRSLFYRDWLAAEVGEQPLLTDKTGTRKGIGFPKTLDVLLIGLFRTDVWLGIRSNGDIRYIGWYMDPRKLWIMVKDSVMDALADSYKDSNYEPTQFIRSGAPYKNYLFTRTPGGKPPEPTVIYDLETGEKYEADGATPTHFLDTSGDIEIKDISISHPATAKLLVRV